MSERELVLGRSLEEASPGSISVTRREMFMAIVGAAGSGKSSLSYHLNIQLANSPERPASVVVDPQTDLAKLIAATIPPHRRGDVVWLDFGDANYPPNLALFARPEALSQEVFADTVYSIMTILFHDILSFSRMQDVLWAVVSTLVAQPSAVVSDIHRLLTDPHFRRRAIARDSNQASRQFWQEYESMSKSEKEKTVDPVIRRVRKLYRSQPVANILCGQKSVNFSELLDRHAIVLVGLAGDAINSHANLLGELVIAHIHMALKARLQRDAEARSPMYLTVDESQQFNSGSLPSMLSQGRKLGLNAMLVTQYFNGWSDDLVNSIYGNVGNVIAFSVGANDAPKLAGSFHPYTSYDLQYLNRLECIARTIINGRPQPATKIRCQSIRVKLGTMSDIVDRSRKLYCTLRAEAERALAAYQLPLDSFEPDDVDED